MYRSYYSIFSLFSRLKRGNCAFLKSCSYTLGGTQSPSGSDTAPLILPSPFFPLFMNLDQLETGQAQAEGQDRLCNGQRTETGC